MWLEDLIDIIEATIKAEMILHRMSGDDPGQPMETLLDRLDRRLAALTELRGDEVTVENLSQGDSLFALTSGPDLLPTAAA